MARAGFELQDMIGRLGADQGWDSLDGLINQTSHPERKKQAEEDAARKEAEKYAFRRDLLTVFSSPAGKRVLERLIAGTVGRPPMNFGTLGLSSDQVGVLSAYRDGQNTVIHALLIDLEQVGFDPSTVGDDDA